MPVHRIRKRYLLLAWQKDEPSPSRLELERLLETFDSESEGGTKQLSRLMILDPRARMGIVKTAHTMLPKLKSQLTEGGDESRQPRFHVIAVSGTIRKLKLRIALGNLPRSEFTTKLVGEAGNP